MNASIALARHRLSRAHTALKEADILIEQGQSGGAINRIYYAAFHAARALLALHRVDSSRHSGVIALFQRHFVKTGIVPDDIARVLPRAFTKRQVSDYGDFAETSVTEVSLLRDEVRLFIGACEAALIASES